MKTVSITNNFTSDEEHVLFWALIGYVVAKSEEILHLHEQHINNDEENDAICRNVELQANLQKTAYNLVQKIGLPGPLEYYSRFLHIQTQNQ